MYRGFTRSEAVGLVCNFSGKLLTVVINIYVLCCFSWRTEAVKFYSVVVPEQSLKTVEEKKAVYQIRRPLGLVFVIPFLAGRIVSVLYLDGL
jgi:hypothetical protein